MQTLNARVLGCRTGKAAQRSNACRAVTTASARVDKCDKKSVIVSPSILSANFAKLGEQVREKTPALSMTLRQPSVPAGR